MFWKSRLLRVGLGCIGVGSAHLALAQSATFFVKPTPLGAQNGTSWENACTLKYALTNARGADEEFQDDVWVAQGTYRPEADMLYPPGSTDPRRRTFYIKHGIKVFGGFLGNELNRTQRNPEVNLTILDGDINVGGNPNADSYHVVYIDHASPLNTKLSGFVIQNGRADHPNDSDDSYGGGIFLKRGEQFDGGPLLDRLYVRNNTARAGGGGFYNNAIEIAYLANCRFENNTVTLGTAGMGGAALLSFHGKATLSNCLFYNNSSAGAGGALAASAPPEAASVRAFNCTFVGNTAAGNANGRKGGAAYSELQYISLFNCIAWGNSAP